MKGSVYRRGDRWEFRFDLPPDPLTGKRKFATRSGFRTRKEAEAALRDAIKAAESGRHVAKSRQTVSQYLDEWLPAVQGRVKPTTWEAFRLTSIENLPGAEVAVRLGVQVSGVFVAKHRVMKLLEEEVRILLGERA